MDNKNLMFVSEEARQALVAEIAGAVVTALKGAGIAGGIATTDGTADRTEWGSRGDACNLIKCSLPTLHSLINDGAIQRQKVGRRTLINLTDLRAKLESGALAKYQRRSQK